MYLKWRAPIKMNENNTGADYTKTNKMIIYQWDNKWYPDSRLLFYARDEIFDN